MFIRSFHGFGFCQRRTTESLVGCRWSFAAGRCLSVHFMALDSCQRRTTKTESLVGCRWSFAARRCLSVHFMALDSCQRRTAKTESLVGCRWSFAAGRCLSVHFMALDSCQRRTTNDRRRFSYFCFAMILSLILL